METTNVLDSKTASTTPPIIWLDITDLLLFVNYSSKVSGIQRVEVGIISNILFNTDIPLQFKFCAMKANDSAFYEIAAFNLKTLLNALAEISTIEFTKWQKLIYWLTAAENNLPPVQFKATDCLLILGCFWGYPQQAQRILQVKREFRVKIIQMIYDLIPILRSEFMMPNVAMEFSLGMYAVIAYADGIVTDSKFTASEVYGYIKQQNNPPPYFTVFNGNGINLFKCRTR